MLHPILIVSKRSTGTQAPRGYRVIHVDRTSALGNPFVMKNEAERDSVCERYARWFHQQADMHSASLFNQTLFTLLMDYQAGDKLALACWCAPKRCHAETIKAWIETWKCDERTKEGERCADITGYTAEDRQCDTSLKDL